MRRTRRACRSDANDPSRNSRMALRIPLEVEAASIRSGSTPRARPAPRSSRSRSIPISAASRTGSISPGDLRPRAPLRGRAPWNGTEILDWYQAATSGPKGRAKIGVPAAGGGAL